MYTILVFAITFFLLRDVTVVNSKPLMVDEQQQQQQQTPEHEDLAVEGLSIVPSFNVSNNRVETVVAKAQVISEEVAKQTILSDNADTKKHYYLFKINEFYDFLPLYSQQDDRYLRLEIIDKDDMGLSGTEEDPREVSRKLEKRSLKEDKEMQISDATLRDSINLLQTTFLRKKKKREISANPPSEYERFLVRSDIGTLYSDPVQNLSVDPDDPENNNSRFVAYVPFFKVRKYYINKKHLSDYL